MRLQPQPWIGGPGFDLAFILSPGIVASLVVLAFPGMFATRELSPLLWAALIVGVDVTHVYSTLFRTYFDGAEFRRAPTLYTLAPLLGWMAFALLYSLGPMVFWRCLAYLAAFHFVRQQYGFMMLYGRAERQHRAIDKAAIYAATLYPLAWWHLHPRQFSWFVEGDFVALRVPFLADALLAAYLAIAAAYLGKEALLIWRTRRVNWPRNLLLGGTALSWWVGIVALDSDLAFTAVNVIAHGLPYMALVWLFGRKQEGARLLGVLPARRAFSLAFLPLFLGVPLLLAYLEEGLWDGLVWNEHGAIFPPFAALPAIESPDLLVLLIPLLALPQITHYILDGFIWRRNHAPEAWRSALR
jgi:hypothetical protein